MSEIINNREQETINKSERHEKLQQIFKDLHSGKDVNEVKAYFDKEIGTITVEEISQLQHDVEGIPLDEMKRLYSTHTEIFKGSIEEIHRPQRPEEEPGHPVHTFKLENKAIENLLKTRVQLHLDQFEKEDSEENVLNLLEDCNLLLDIDKHYSRKENLIFPYLERYGIYGPTNNMWKIDDYIRDYIKDAKRQLASYNGDKQAIVQHVNYILTEVSDMIYREENILFPMALMNFTEDKSDRSHVVL